MMSWSTAQRSRLTIEKDLLEKYFQGRVKWCNLAGSGANVEIEMTTNNDQTYTIRVYLPKDFPDSCRDMVLVSPGNPRLKNGNALPFVSAKFHTVGERDRYMKICHVMPKLWIVSSVYERSPVDQSL